MVSGFKFQVETKECTIDGWGWDLYNTHYHNINYLILEVYGVLRQGTGDCGIAA